MFTLSPVSRVCSPIFDAVATIQSIFFTVLLRCFQTLTVTDSDRLGYSRVKVHL